MSKTRRIVFVCSGNICRSPMAAAIARDRFEKAGIAAQFISMGTLGIFGKSASGLAQTVCAEHGLDLGDHASQGVSLGILQHADAVIVMEAAHRDFLSARRRDLDNLRMMSSFDSEPGPADVADPIGGSHDDYERCFERLERCVAGMLKQIGRGLL